MSDEAFHEIQLNGKQLVFLFMAATVVSVVIFLCGVMVGRGVRAPAGDVADVAASSGGDPTADIQPPAGHAPGDTAAPASVPPSEEDLTYPERLEDPAAPAESLNPVAPESRAAASPAPRAPASSGKAAAAPAGGEPFTVQVAAVKQRDEAETIARRLTRKGYAAYVMPPASGAPAVFRVRVGRFSDRREAESVAARLEKEEQFKPWVTR
jgi:cell division septation protein DedD